MDIWAECGGASAIRPISGELVRMVESQERVATTALVDDLAEQDLLEQMLEVSKHPAHPASSRLHYLLTTAFRYPPLRHGSRFGGRAEPSLFYGAQTTATALAECAYYRLVFWSGMAKPPPTGKLISEHTLFGAVYGTQFGIQLQAPPFHGHQAYLTDRVDYTATQLLGAQMRKAGMEAFEYPSARDPQGGINIALYTPDAFQCPAPVWQQQWVCDTRADRVSFSAAAGGTRQFHLSQFEVSGNLPSPAM